MTEAEALARLTMMVSPTEDPVLSGDELELLLEDALVVDYLGLAPKQSDGTATTGYTATWDLKRAAAAAWEVKAGKVASRFDFNSDVHGYKRDQLQKHCLEMAKQYRKGDVGTINIGAGVVYDPVIGNLNGAA